MAPGANPGTRVTLSYHILILFYLIFRKDKIPVCLHNAIQAWGKINKNFDTFITFIKERDQSWYSYPNFSGTSALASDQDHCRGKIQIWNPIMIQNSGSKTLDLESYHDHFGAKIRISSYEKLWSWNPKFGI